MPQTLVPTEQHHAASQHLGILPTAEMLLRFHAADYEACQAVDAALPQLAVVVDAVSTRMRSGGRLFYLGAGTSGRLGVLDASEIPPTFGADPGLVVGLIAGGDGALRRSVEGAEDDDEQAASDLAPYHLTASDSLVGISASGNAAYVLGGLTYAARQGSLTIALTCNPNAAMLRAAELAIVCPTGAEMITGSTRLKAGSATKMILNMLSSAVMVRLGKTYGQLMVDVQASNSKLKDRALRLVMELTGVEAALAQKALDECGGKVKLAVLCLTKNITPPQAEALLAQHGGHLRTALSQEENGYV